MDSSKVSILLKNLRLDCQLTQAQVAERLGVSDKAVSKWERGLGCPDISLLNELASIYGVEVETLLAGTITVNKELGGNMKRIKFYICPVCGNVLTSTAQASVSCCGRRLEALTAKEADDKHRLNLEDSDGEYFITINHEMTKEHYISFVAYTNSDRLLLVKLYPEQSPQLRFPIMHGGRYYFGCTNHGLWTQK